MTQRRARACTHHWLVSEPQLRRVSALCRRCGARRTYPAGLDFHEARVDYAELDRSRLALLMDAASREEHSRA